MQFGVIRELACCAGTAGIDYTSFRPCGLRFAYEINFRYERNLQSNPVSLRPDSSGRSSRGSHPSLLSFGLRSGNEKRTTGLAVRVGKKYAGWDSNPGPIG